MNLNKKNKMNYLQKIYSDAFDEGVNFYTQRIFNEDEKTSYGKSSLIGAGIGGTVLGGIARKNNHDKFKERDRLYQRIKELDKKWREHSLDVDETEIDKLRKKLEFDKENLPKPQTHEEILTRRQKLNKLEDEYDKMISKLENDKREEHEKLYKELTETEKKLTKFHADTPELEKKASKHFLKMGGIGLLGGASLGLGYAYYKNNKKQK